MIGRIKNIAGLLPGIVLATSFPGPARSATYESYSVTPPKPAREFRAAWVATVANIDWPSRKDLTTAEQKAELLALLDRAAQLKLNAVIFQVRPGCDALYASSIEPWSEYLTGTMGQPPAPFYDPLTFAVEEAHKRGLELHAWFNPYRARHIGAKSPIAANHISKTRPQLVRQYGRFLWLDPGEKDVQDYCLSVVMDVVKRYDIDGVHFDDYFYPYKINDDSGRELDFPDDASWKKFGAPGRESRDDWRRENVNAFIERTYKSIKAARPTVKFGVSPFGIWRPGYPAQIKGHDAYAKLYADSRKWLAQGWVDYFVPQLYWAIGPPEQSFPVLLKWWAEQNAKNRHLWPGLDATRTSGQWKPEEIVNQVRLARKQSGASGQVYWNVKSLARSSALGETLAREVYEQAALVPASPWLDRTQPPKPVLACEPAATGSSVRAQWSSGGPQKPWLWLVQTKTGDDWKTEVWPAQKTAQTWTGSRPDIIAITEVNRSGNAGPTAAAQLKR
jgi:uncharacterized lipoprotein YddW (UPF0748 family)